MRLRSVRIPRCKIKSKSNQIKSLVPRMCTVQQLLSNLGQQRKQKQKIRNAMQETT